MDPLLIDVPPRLETPRLILRCPQPGDGARLNEAVRDSLAELRPWMPWAQSAPTLEESECWCRRQQARFLLREDLVWLILEREPGGAAGCLVGGVGLHRIDWTLRRFEVGYWARSGHAGQGYISEAVRTLTRMAFERLDARRVEVRMDDRNEASQRVAESAGFSFEGLLRHERVAVDGSLRDTCVYAKVREATATAPAALAGESEATA
jgi:RimJ/RimL family protein N-acetyltransferase